MKWLRSSGIKTGIFVSALFFYALISINMGICQQNQEISFKQNTIFLDLTTKGAYYSINYDRIFYRKA